MPHMCGVVTARTALVAIAASTALPPAAAAWRHRRRRRGGRPSRPCPFPPGRRRRGGGWVGRWHSGRRYLSPSLRRAPRVGPRAGATMAAVTTLPDRLLGTSSPSSVTPTCSPTPTSPRATSVDWTGRFLGATPAVVRPARLDEVAAGRAIVRGGGRPRSCPRAATPASSAVRCRCTARSCSACAGSTRSAPSTAAPARSPPAPAPRSPRCSAHARAAPGWAYGVDLAARDSATIGGTVATNAGGVHVLRYGGTRAPGRWASRPCSATARS